jgi:hypothetical protein
MIENILFIFIIILIIYFFYIHLINTIDKKLNSINIDINYPEYEHFNNTKSETFDSESDNTSNKKIINKKEYTFIDNNLTKTNFDNEYYEQMNKNNRVEGFFVDPPNTYKEWDIEKKQTQVCCKNHEHKKDGRDLNCTYGVTNYSDPHDMSPIDLRLFQLNYPQNMTLQDYINWLYCFIDKEDELPYNHLKNLQKLKAGKELIQEDGILPPPGYYYPASNSENYFKKMYNTTQEFNIASPLNSSTGPMLGYNYDQYSEFLQNMDLKGQSGDLRNPDIGLKKNAKKLYNYINPQDSNNINMDNKYQIYRMKNVEI